MPTSTPRNNSLHTRSRASTPAVNTRVSTTPSSRTSSLSRRSSGGSSITPVSDTNLRNSPSTTATTPVAAAPSTTPQALSERRADAKTAANFLRRTLRKATHSKSEIDTIDESLQQVLSYINTVDVENFRLQSRHIKFNRHVAEFDRMRSSFIADMGPHMNHLERISNHYGRLIFISIRTFEQLLRSERQMYQYRDGYIREQEKATRLEGKLEERKRKYWERLSEKDRTIVNLEKEVELKGRQVQWMLKMRNDAEDEVEKLKKEVREARGEAEEDHEVHDEVELVPVARRSSRAISAAFEE